MLPPLVELHCRITCGSITDLFYRWFKIKPAATSGIASASVTTYPPFHALLLTRPDFAGSKYLTCLLLYLIPFTPEYGGGCIFLISVSVSVRFLFFTCSGGNAYTHCTIR